MNAGYRTAPDDPSLSSLINVAVTDAAKKACAAVDSSISFAGRVGVNQGCSFGIVAKPLLQCANFLTGIVETAARAR